MTTTKFAMTLPLITDQKGSTIAQLAANLQILDDHAASLEQAMEMAEVATPASPASGYNALYFKSDDKLYKKTSAGVESEIGAAASAGDVVGPTGATGDNLAVFNSTTGKLIKDGGVAVAGLATATHVHSPWTAETNFTATPASTSTLTMTSDKTAIILVGYGLRYTIAGTVYYGIVTAIASNLLTLAGAPLGGDVTALAWCDPTRICQVDFFISGAFADAANTGLLASDAKTKFRWSMTKAYLVKILHTVRIDDTGANQPRVTLSVNGSAVGTSNTNAGEAVAETWTATVVAINTSNYDILNGEAIEVVTDANGSNDNATDLTVSGIFVIP